MSFRLKSLRLNFCSYNKIYSIYLNGFRLAMVIYNYFVGDGSIQIANLDPEHIGRFKVQHTGNPEILPSVARCKIYQAREYCIRRQDCWQG